MATSQLTTDESSWDMRVTYFDTVAGALQLAFQARILKKVNEWFDILDGIYARVGPMGCANSDLDELIEDLCSKIYGEQDPDGLGMPEEIEMSEAIDDLRKLEKKLIARMHEKNLLVPKRGDPNHTWAEGTS